MPSDKNFTKLGILAIASTVIFVGLGLFLMNKAGLNINLEDFFKGEYKQSLKFSLSSNYKKPEAWVISQGLNSTLTKQQLLQQSAKNGQASLDDLARVATASTTIKAEAVKIGSDYLLSTGADGKVEISVEPGKYSIELIPIPGIDFTGVPGRISISSENYFLNIGLLKGSGKVRTESGGLKIEDGNEGKLRVVLFQDKNGNGQKDEGESDLPWARVTVKLVRGN